MRAKLLLALAITLLIAECVAKLLGSQTWAIALFGATAAVVAIRWALGPQTEDECPADCRKCADDLL